MKLHKNKLAAKVFAVNAVNAEINRIAPLFLEAFRPLVGQKIMKVGGVMEKFAKLIPARSPSIHHFYRNPSDYTLSFTVKDCQSLEGYGCVYYEGTFYVGDVPNGVLSKLYEFTPLRTDYTEAEILEARAEVEAAKNSVLTAQHKLFSFGEYDN